MNLIKLATVAILVGNLLFSVKGFQDANFRERYLFHVGPIRYQKDWVRMLSSGFLHGDWMHLIFNMYTLYVFADIFSKLPLMNLVSFLLLYFGSLLGGNALALYIHRNHDDYRALGASGAVSGVVFAAIAMILEMRLFFNIPAWLFAIVYTLVTIYGIKSSWGNIGHEAHLGGSIIGVAMAIAVRPTIVQQHPILLLGIVLPMVVFLYFLVMKPEFLLIPNYLDYQKRQVSERFKRSAKQPKVKSSPKTKRKPKGQKRFISPEAELNFLLDKVQQEGYEKLSRQEKDRLEELSRKLE
ncbi:MAG: rhomboid family intramembrane serine protease [Bacteroidota bacterium]